MTARLAAASRRPARPKPPSAWVLVAANLVPLAGVLFWDWSVLPLILLFWMENVVLGVLFIPRLLFAQADPTAGLRLPLPWGLKLFMAPFFCLHYGVFTAAHGAFIFAWFGGYRFEGLWVLEHAMRAAQEHWLWLPLAALVASHLFSFAWNYLYRGEFRRVDVGRLLVAPYARVVVLHIALLFGGFGVMILGSPLWALLLLLAAKIWLDLTAHLKEHAAK